jgi:hypothetical protein
MTRRLPLNADGSLHTWALPHGYPLYYITADPRALCPACATDALHDTHPRWRPVDTQYGAQPRSCDACTALLDPA